MSPLLAILDSLRRDYGVVIRGAHHNRKVQGTHRAGRGSQELAGSYQLGAWAENSLFFEPIGKREGLAKVTAQCKDLEPTPPFSLRLETEGQAGDPEHPLVHRLLAEELKTTSAAEECKEKVYAALASLPPTDQPVTQGSPGVTVKQLAEALHCSDKTVRKALDLLKDEGRCLEIGKLSKQTKLYGVKPL